MRRPLLTAASVALLSMSSAVLAAQAGNLVPDGTEFQVNTYTSLDQKDQRVAPDGNGGFVVVWESWLQDGNDFGIFGQRYDAAGIPLGNEFQINDYTAGRQASPAVATVGSGFFVAWFSEQPESFWDIFGRHYDGDGVPLGGEFRINSYTADGQRHPSIAALSNGGFVVVWQSALQDDPSGGPFAGGIYGQRFDATGVPAGGEFQVNTYTPFDQWFPVVSADPSGGFVVVWASQNQDGDGFGIFGQRYDDDGAPLGIEFQVNTYTTGRQDFPAVATDDSGGFLVVWHSEQDGDGYGIFGQRYDASGAPLGGEFQINTETAGDQLQPTLAFDESSGFLVVYESGYADLSGSDIFGQRYDGDGVPIGNEFQVSAPGSHFRHLANLTADGSGGFIVVWQSDQDGSDQGVFGQRYVLEQTACSDGQDNDGDGSIDLADPGCDDEADADETSPALPCDDGIDNDDDGRIDFDPLTYANPGDQNNDPAGRGDPVCTSPTFWRENAQCQDGLHNDGDGKMDYDGGRSIHGAAGTAPDPQCGGRPWKNKEGSGCGLGCELAFLLPALMWLHRRRSAGGLEPAASLPSESAESSGQERR